MPLDVAARAHRMREIIVRKDVRLVAVLRRNHLNRVVLSRKAGFTLLEILVALVIMGVASSIFLTLYSASSAVAQSNRSMQAAANLAGEYLTAIIANPNQYRWPDFDKKPYGALYPVLRVGDEGLPSKQADPPRVRPTNEQASEREKNFYAGFSWEAFTVLPAEDADYVEVLVNVWWQERGRDRVFSLTSCLPRHQT